MIHSENKINNVLSLALPLALGVIAFVTIVGPRVLDPTNIAWLGAGDPATHYLGWLFYRNSGWEFPIGLNPSYGLELANAIVYSDSNPLFAFIFKPFSSLLPQTFQYFGIWLLLCFVLQAFFGWKLVGLVTSSNWLRLCGAGMIVIAPPMIWRLHGHLSLVAHFLILAALYCAFDENLKKRKFSWGLIVAVSALVHVYLLAMVLAIWIADLAGRTGSNQVSVRNSAFEFFAIVVLLGVVCWQAGYFSVGSGVSTGGFGFYRMNILAPLDPSGWSYILRDLPEAAGDYEGFNYLGLGSIFLILLSAPCVVAGKESIICTVREYWYLLLLFLFFILFALSSAPGVGLYSFKISLPGPLLGVANIFRSSGRFFWPVFYAICFASIVLVVRNFDKRTAGVVLGLALIVQILDTSAGWLPIRKKNMVGPSSEWVSPLVNEFWSDASRKYRKVRHIPVGNVTPEWQVIACYAGVNGLSTDAVYLARVDSIALEKAKQKESDVLKSGVFDQDSLYILSDSALRAAFFAGNPGVDLFAKIDGFNVVAPGWKRCVDCRFPGGEIKTNDLFKPITVGERLLFNASGYGVDYLGKGWSTPEPWGTWSDSTSSMIFLPVKAKEVDSIIFEFNALISPSHLSQYVEILVNGIRVSSMTIRKYSENVVEVKVPDEAKLDSFPGIEIEFLLPDAARPKDVGLGDDDRTLALGLLTITLR